MQHLSFWNRADLWWNGVEPGINQPRLWAVPFILLCFFLLFGPCPRIYQPCIPGGIWTILGCLVLIVVVACGIQASNRSDFALCGIQIGVVVFLFLCSCGLAFLGHLNPDSPRFREADPGVYMFPHLWHALAMIVFTFTLIGWWSADWRLDDIVQKFRDEKIDLAKQLQHADLLNPKFRSVALAPNAKLAADELSVEQKRRWSSVYVPLTRPLELLLPVALTVLLISGPIVALLESWHLSGVSTFIEWRPTIPFVSWFIPVRLTLLEWAVFAITWRVLMHAETDPNSFAATVVTGFRQLFMVGGLFVVSALVLLLAIAWITEFSYARTVMEGDRTVVFMYVLAAYSLVWCHEYWLNRSINLKLLNLINATSPESPEPVKRSVRAASAEKPVIDVRLHGATRLAVFQLDNEGRDIRYRPYNPLRLVERLIESLEDVSSSAETENTQQNGTRSQRDQHLAGRDLLGLLEQRFRNHFLTVNILILFVVVGVFRGVTSRERLPLVAVDETATGNVSIQNTVFPKGSKQSPLPRKVIMIAASGGGTRAALFTSSALEGLREAKLLDKVLLGSGVSGGSAALAYFAAHRPELLAAETKSPEWDRFHQAMAAPYITDVVRGASEFRISAQTTIGVLLAESFQREFWRDLKTHQPTDTNLSFRDVPHDFGLILNSTLCGEWPPDFRDTSDKDWDPIHRASDKYTSGIANGSRVIFTNLTDKEAFPIKGSESPSAHREHLKYHVVADPAMPLVSAAALSANFPPVFPNAPIELGTKGSDGKIDVTKRLWLTDGGAEENKGENSLLFALRKALRDQLDLELKPDIDIPDIDILVIEASAGSVEYHHDQGIGALGGSGTRLANQLGWELEIQVATMFDELVRSRLTAVPLKKLPRLKVHFVPMPSVLRVDSGLGTHWMMPEVVRFRQTAIPGEQRKSVSLRRESVLELIRDLNQSKPTRTTDSPASTRDRKSASEQTALKTIWEWIRKDRLFGDPHTDWDRWTEMLDQIRK